MNHHDDALARGAKDRLRQTLLLGQFLQPIPCALDAEVVERVFAHRQRLQAEIVAGSGLRFIFRMLVRTAGGGTAGNG